MKNLLIVTTTLSAILLTSACAVGPRWVDRTVVHKDKATGDVFTDTQKGFVLLDPWESTPDRAKAGRTAALTSPEVERMYIENELLKKRGGLHSKQVQKKSPGKVTSFCEYQTRFKITDEKGVMVEYKKMKPRSTTFIALPPGNYYFWSKKEGGNKWVKVAFSVHPEESFTRSLIPLR